MGPNLDPGQLERQQALLMERLRAADGAAVSFDELRAIGIENPALLCYELAAVGVPLTRTSAAGEGMPALSVRLEPTHETSDRAPESSQQQPPTRVLPRVPRLSTRRLDAAGAQAHALFSTASAAVRLAARARQARVRDRVGPPALAAMFALAAVLGAVIAIAASHGTGGAPTGSQRARAEVPTSPAGARRAAPARPSPAPTHPSLPIPLAARGAAGSGARISPAQAASLQAEGHQLLANGSYGTAIARLMGAINASGQGLADCVEPSSETCLTFAYALYDLGRALRLQGDHAAAIAVLSQRLRIDDQRPVVQHELELARGASA